MEAKPRTADVAVPRRTLLKGALSATALTILSRGKAPAWAIAPKAVSPNEKINLACVGIGGRGDSVTGGLGRSRMTNVVALCDVEMGGGRTKGSCRRFPDAPKFKDFRKMFDKLGGEIDAVSIAVPDHTHFPIAMLAMSLGKHVYVEKPLAHTFEEVELMMAARTKYKVATQMGNQGHSGNNYLQFKSWVAAGVIKDVTRISAYMNGGRRWHGWKIKGFPTGEKMPETIDWDTWLGTARPHEYSSRYTGGDWRCWYDFGNGAIGDWGPHILDTAHQFLKLGLPTRITAEKIDGANKWIFPQASTIGFDFPARGKMPPVKVTWYDGTANRPPRPKELDARRRVGGNGKIIFGGDLVFKGGSHGSTLRIIPEAKMRDMASKVPRITERQSNHFDNFLLACKGQETCRSSFNVSGPLTQVLLLGVIAQRLGGTLEFDLAAKQITNNPIANQLLVGPPPRKGWEQFYKMA